MTKQPTIQIILANIARKMDEAQVASNMCGTL